MIYRFSILFSFLLLFTTSEIYAQQMQSSVVNYLKFGNGLENYGEGGFLGERKKQFLENITDVRLFFPNITIGFRLEKSDPPEYGITRSGLVKKFIEYEKGGLTFRAGTIYDLFGKGLTLNLFENRSLAFDTGLDGFNAEYRNDNFFIKIIAGKINYLEPLTLTEPTQRFEEYNLKGINSEFIITESFKLNGSVIWAEGDFLNEATKINENITSTLPEISLNYQVDNLNFITSIGFKSTLVKSQNFSGRGIYSSLQYTSDWFGIVTEYKNYSYNEVIPEERNNFKRASRALPFQNAPIVHKEHSYTILKRYPHVVDFNDEVGWQIDAFFSIKQQTTLNFNIAASSRHNEYELQRSSWTSKQKNISKLLFPSANSTYSPFFELFAEVEHFFDGDENYIKIAADKRSEITYDIFNSTKPLQKLETFTVPIELQFLFSDKYSIRANIEEQWVTKFPSPKEFNNTLIAIQISQTSFYSIGFRYEMTTSSYEPNNEKKWLVIESSLRLGKNHTMFVSYGDERGGQICSNGLCRTLMPFSGFRFSLTSVF